MAKKLAVVEKTEQQVDPTEEQTPVAEIQPEEKVVAHPKFEERINEFRGRLGDLEERLKREQAGREQDKQAFDILSKQYSDLSSTMDTVEQQVSISTAPDYEVDPKAYMDWQHQQTIKTIEKMVKTQTPPPVQSVPQQTITPNNNQIDPRQTVVAALHKDYYEVVAEAQKDMEADPSLRAAFIEQPNPYQAAYDHVINKRKHKEALRQGTVSQAFAEGGGGGVTTQDVNTLTSDEKALVAKMQARGQDITEEKYLEGKKRIAARRSKK